MSGFRRPLQRLCALALLKEVTRGVFATGSHMVEIFDDIDYVSVENDYFSQPWVEQYSEGAPGCEVGRGSYTWRRHGFGSNINNMLNAWVYFIAVEGWSDISLICDDDQFKKLTCFEESEGLVSQGWGCLFGGIPHMCVFETPEAWTNYTLSANISDEDLHTTAGLNLSAIRGSTDDIVNCLDGLSVDHLGALTVLVKYLWSFMTPWLRKDVHFVTNAEKTIEGKPFLGMHVRRGDKLRHEAKAVAVEEYLKAAVDYLEEGTTQTGLDDIKAIWVASDDPNIVDEVRTLAPTYFPHVCRDAIVYASGGVTGGPNTQGVRTRTKKQGYGSFVYFLADLEQLAASELFVGTFSSNVARLVMLLREGQGKLRNSSISLDKGSWYPARQRGLLMD